MGNKRQSLGERVRSLRGEAGMTQLALAQASGLSMSIIAQIEQGGKADPKLSTLQSLAASLGVSVGGLIGENNGEKTSRKSADRP